MLNALRFYKEANRKAYSLGLWSFDIVLMLRLKCLLTCLCYVDCEIPFPSFSSCLVYRVIRLSKMLNYYSVMLKVVSLLAALALAYNTNLFGALTHYSSGQAAVYYGGLTLLCISRIIFIDSFFVRSRWQLVLLQLFFRSYLWKKKKKKKNNFNEI